MIGGDDLVLDVEDSSELRETVWAFFTEKWPGGVVDNGAVAVSGLGTADEQYFYRSNEMRREWMENGATPECEDAMVQLLYEPHRLTIVSHHSGETKQMALELADRIRSSV